MSTWKYLPFAFVLGCTDSRVQLATAARDVSTPSPQCALEQRNSGIKHIVYVQFDNTHFTRDIPNVPSDLEQMPHLLDFITRRGTLLSKHHTPLISHTADDVLTSLSGVYPDRHGQAVANGFGFFTPPASRSFDGFASSFSYWTDPVNATTDTHFNMITQDGHNAPAPWVPFTRAGCNVGAVSIANMELENVAGDITTVFGMSSPEADEVRSNRAQATADFVGIAIHCAANSPLCATGKPDLLPDEPNGYNGFNALYGHRNVAAVISPSTPLLDLDGHTITDGNGHTGFPGFGGITATQTLGYTATMLENGVPVVFAYISDAHDNRDTGHASGPGEASYVARLADYDRAWANFFARLARDGITEENTLFVFTADEGDHFAGGAPSPATCDGVSVPCMYEKLGEVDVNIGTLLHQQDPALATSFDIHFDMAPAFYINSNPSPGAPLAREFERAAASLTATSPISGDVDHLMRYLADPVELKVLHMITGDPQRTPSFVMFGHPDYYFQTSGADVQENPGFAWNHGGVSPDIDVTWLGMVGPGVRLRGVDDHTWSDHTDIRPTVLMLAGLSDDYVHDGRVLVEALHEDTLPRSLRGDSGFWFELLARTYKQLNAPLGHLGRHTLSASTTALAGDDATYARIEEALADLGNRRDELAGRMILILEDAAFHGRRPDPLMTFILAAQAEELLEAARQLDQ
jgi:hypothetical protein